MVTGIFVVLTAIALVLSGSTTARATTSPGSSPALTSTGSTSGSTSGSTAEPTAGPTAGATDGSALDRVRAVVDAQPASAHLTRSEREHLASVLHGLGTALAEGQPTRPGAQPSWSVGLGWYIYIHHITPTDQRWFLQVGIGVVATTLCAVSAATLCAVAGVAAVVLVTTISEYFNPTLCLEAELTYSGRLHRIYSKRC